MIVTVQAIPERLEYIKSVTKDLNPIYHVDHEYSGPLGSFIQMLQYPVDRYRLHLQDDIILAKDFDKYLGRIQYLMDSRGLHVLSLFAPRRKKITEAYKAGLTISTFPNFLWLQATVFSSEFCYMMRKNIHQTTEKKHDDVFVQEILRRYKITAHVHTPSLVQHNVGLGSSMGHANTDRRTSEVYDENYITKILKL